MAYALLSLIQIIEQDRHHVIPRLRPHIESFLETTRFLRDIVENSSTISGGILETFENRIRDSAHEAEDIIESHVTDHLLSVPEEEAYELDLTYVAVEFDCIKDEMLKIVDGGEIPAKMPMHPAISSPSKSNLSSDNIDVVGLDRDISQLLDQLMGNQPQLQIISIVGMGGCGKTTLAHKLFYHSSTTSHFADRVWVTISKEFNMQATLFALVDGLLGVSEKMPSGNDTVLGEFIYQRLAGRRYLIVVDDIWHTHVWDKIRWMFRDDNSGSRIILTTRDLDLAEYAKSSSKPHQMVPIDEDASWKLFIRKVFKTECCPPELVETGRKIARYCKGLPLALVTMGGLLSTFEKNRDAWELVEEHQLKATIVKEEVDTMKKKMAEIEVDPSLRGIVDLFGKNGLQLLDRLTGKQSKLQIIAIIGKGGTGKTTLAQLLYNRTLLVGQFDIHAWTTISQERRVVVTLHDLLNSLRNRQVPRVNDDELGTLRHKTLKFRRYLILVDGLRDIATWNQMQIFFPDDENGSRIILTAKDWSEVNYHRIKPFHLDSYWEFLLQKAFKREYCPLGLDDTGMKVAGFLPMFEKTLEFWKLIEEKVSSPKSNHDLSLDLLSVSYNHLPYHLKPCFLYMGAFPEDYEIQVSKIIKLWIAEGFVHPVGDTNFEHTAEMYLQFLVDRNLLFACGKKYGGKTKTFKIHDIFWKFCQKKACEENFLWFKNLDGKNIPQDEEIMRRMSVNPLCQPTDEVELMPLIRSFLCIGPASQDLAPMFFGLRLLRVLDVLQLQFDQFPEEMLKLVNLRYMAFTCHSEIPSSISIFRYLQTLITSMAFSLPSELWKMKELRHVKCKETCVWYYSGNGESMILAKLQTLSNVPVYMVTKEFLGKIPNLRKLGIYCDTSRQSVINLDCLHKLEKLKCSSDWSLLTHDFLSNLVFPASLKKLTVCSCNISRGFMRTVGLLPNLEQLKLQNSDFVDKDLKPEWEPSEGEFLKLISLELKDLNMVNWKAKSTNFPVLRRLVIIGCWSMKEIPCDIGEIETLELIEVDVSSTSLLASALQIQEVHSRLGKDLPRVVFLDA